MSTAFVSVAVLVMLPAVTSAAALEPGTKNRLPSRIR